MSNQPGMRSARGVFARPTLTGVLVTDTNAAFAITVPHEMLQELSDAFEAKRPATFVFDHAAWTLTPDGSATHLTATHEDELFEDLVIEDPGAWRQVLGEAAKVLPS